MTRSPTDPASVEHEEDESTFTIRPAGVDRTSPSSWFEKAKWLAAAGATLPVPYRALRIAFDEVALEPVRGVLSTAWFIAIVFVIFAFLRERKKAPSKAGVVQVDSEGLTVTRLSGEAWRIDRADVAFATMEDHASSVELKRWSDYFRSPLKQDTRPLVRLELHNGDLVTVRCPPEDALRILEVLKLDTSARRATVKSSWGVSLPVRYSLLSFLGFFSVMTGLSGYNSPTGLWTRFALITVFYGLIAYAAHRLEPDEVDVGTDGVLLRLRGQKDRYVSYSQFDTIGADLSEARVNHVSGMEAQDPCLYLHLHDGEAIKLKRFRWGKAVTLRHEIETAMARRARAGRSPLSSQLAAGSQDTTAWRDALMKLIGGSDGYRGAAMTVEDALAIVNDPKVDAEERVAAASAVRLAGAMQEPERKQLRILADQSAHPKLRIALQQLADDEHENDADAVDEALACVSATKRA